MWFNIEEDMKEKVTLKFRTSLLLVIAFTLCTLWGCSVVPEKQAVEEFKKANPDAVLHEHFIGEGDSDHAYYHFRYSEKQSNAKLEVVWLYQRQKDNTWKVIAKEGPKPSGSKFGD